MPLRTVSRIGEVQDRKAVIVKVDGINLGIIRFDGKYYAYENTCAHQGGPACEGEIIGRMECEVSEKGSILSEYVSSENFVVACPWHGVEYDLKTGVCTANSELALRSFEVVVDGNEIKVEM